jgi:catechol 2,3-dioxygenase-like lactoylglutathione lyase family enzyme
MAERRAPATIGPVRLNHVSLTVADRDRSAAFYGEHFGLTDRLHDEEQFLILGSPGGDGLLALRVGSPPTPLPEANHFGFQVDDPDDVRRARERLRAAGVVETEWQDSHGFVRVQVADPDGYRVEVFGFLPEA